MSAFSPEEVDHIFVQAMNAGDVDAIMELYSPATVLVNAPGEPAVRGMDQLRAFTQRFVDLRPHLTVEPKQCVRADDIALVSVRWRLTGIEPGGHPVSISGIDANVVRRLADGTWRTAIDNPFHDQYIGQTLPMNSGNNSADRAR